MNMDQVIQRINELSRLQKSVGLTDEQREEQNKLRVRYIEAFKSSLRNQLDTITVVDGGSSSDSNQEENK